MATNDAGSILTVRNALVLIGLWLLYQLLKALYNISPLHPLSHVPGPKLAAATYIPEFYYDVVQFGRYTREIKKMHEKYGKQISVTSFCIYKLVILTFVKAPWFESILLRCIATIPSSQMRFTPSTGASATSQSIRSTAQRMTSFIWSTLRMHAHILRPRSQPRTSWLRNCRPRLAPNTAHSTGQVLLAWHDRTS